MVALSNDLIAAASSFLASFIAGMISDSSKLSRVLEPRMIPGSPSALKPREVKASVYRAICSR